MVTVRRVNSTGRDGPLCAPSHHGFPVEINSLLLYLFKEGRTTTRFVTTRFIHIGD